MCQVCQKKSVAQVFKSSVLSQIDINAAQKTIVDAGGFI